MKKKLLITFGILVTLAAASYVAKADTTVLTENYEAYSDEAVMADFNCYTFVNFPGAGHSDGTCLSPDWESDTGGFTADVDSGGNHWGRTVGDGSGLWRLNTTETAAEPTITWDYKADRAQNATDVWLDYQTQYWLYAVQFDRSDNCIVAKRKVPTNTSASGEWGGVAAGHGAEIANKGIYYTLRIDADTPAHAGGPCNVDGVTWTQVGGTNTVHDATLNGGTVYSYKATLRVIPAATCGTSFDCVQIQLWRDGVLYASWTDSNNGKNFDGTRTTQQDCDAGWFTTVTGYTADWCKPITAGGKSGFRNDDVLVAWFDNVVLTDTTTGGGGGGGNFSTSTIALKSGTISVRSGTVFIK